MKETYISTREVAGLLDVTETTVKRWTDSNRIKCVKTLGGHRKYLLNDIEEFAKENNIPITGITPPLSNEQMEKFGYAIFSKNMNKVMEVILEEALQGDREGMFELLIYLTKNRIKFVNLVDEIVQPVLEKIGNLWENNLLEVEQEHLASDTIKTALSRLVVHLPRQKGKNIKIICACSEGEQHDIGLQALAYELELSGYSLHYLGANTPFQSLIKVIKKEKPKYVFISATSPSISEREFIEGIKKVSKTAKSNKAKFVIGGRYVQHFDKDIIGCDAIVNSVKEINSFIKNQTNNNH